MSNDFPQKNDKIFGQILPLSKGKMERKYKIVSCSLPPDVKTRFAEMGLVKDTAVAVIKKAPLGDPLEIAVRGYALCIRAKDAQHFSVVELCDE